MASPIDRSKLSLAEDNQQASKVASSQANIETIKVLYDYADTLNNQDASHSTNPVLAHPDGSVTRAKLANGAVNSSKIEDGAVIPSKIPNQSLTFDKFVPSALTNETQNALRIDALQADVTQRAINLASPPYNVRGDGTDETIQIQQAINDAAGGGSLIWPLQQGSHYETGPLFVPGEISIEFQPGVLVKARSGYGASDRMFSFLGDNISINGNYATLQMLKSEYTTGEHRHALYILGVENINVQNLNIKDTGGDGVLIGPNVTTLNKAAKNIRISGCILDNNRRQGVSIVGAEDVIIKDCIIKNTIGTNPQSGIDVEPNNLTYSNRNILLQNNTLINNVAGILVYNNSFDVRVIGNTLFNSNSIVITRTESGQPSPTVVARDNIINSSSAVGIYLRNVHNIEIINNTIQNPTTHGIFAQQDITDTSYSNRIVSNRIINAGGKGINLESSKNFSLIGNYIENSTSDGIALSSACDYTEISENNLKKCNGQPGRGAIDIRTSNYCIIRSNIIRKDGKSTAYGIYIQGSCVETVIEDNDLYDSATTDYFSDSTSTVYKVNRLLTGVVSPRRVSSLPSANKAWLGTFVLKINAGADDTLHVCIVDSTGAYVFKQITLS